MNAEITVRAELRPAILTNVLFNDDPSKDSTRDENVLVHTTKEGMHGGYMCELEDGRMIEVDPSMNCFELRFTDHMHVQYCFGDEEAER